MNVMFRGSCFDSARAGYVNRIVSYAHMPLLLSFSSKKAYKVYNFDTRWRHSENSPSRNNEHRRNPSISLKCCLKQEVNFQSKLL